MAETFIERLEGLGFQQADTGGGCQAMIRQREGATEVITAADDPALPSEGNWQWILYDGDWLADSSAPVLDCGDHESSPLHLFEFLKI